MANLLVPASNLNVLEFAIFLRGAVVGKTRTLILLNIKRLRQCTAVAACYTDMALLLACGGSSDNYDAPVSDLSRFTFRYRNMVFVYK